MNEVINITRQTVVSRLNGGDASKVMLTRHDIAVAYGMKNDDSAARKMRQMGVPKAGRNHYFIDDVANGIMRERMASM
ncbi:MAG: hypothetical protein J6P16_01670 [Eubacterium sp.]|nr:hypothetical protein [Eubacterium sp.]